MYIIYTNVVLYQSASQVWFQNCRARHKKHVSPNHSSVAPVSSLQPARLSPPLLDELQYTAFAPVDTPMLTALHSYMDGTLCSDGILLYHWFNELTFCDRTWHFVLVVHSPNSLVLQPLLPHSMTQLPISHAWDARRSTVGQVRWRDGNKYLLYYWLSIEQDPCCSIFHGHLLKDIYLAMI